MAPGTDIFVQELFFNTPARLKYIKSLHTEGAHVVDAVTRAALAHPEVAFTLSADGRPVATTPGTGDCSTPWRRCMVGISRKNVSRWRSGASICGFGGWRGYPRSTGRAGGT